MQKEQLSSDEITFNGWRLFHDKRHQTVAIAICFLKSPSTNGQKLYGFINYANKIPKPCFAAYHEYNDELTKIDNIY